jgi:hypothetical protein
MLKAWRAYKALNEEQKQIIEQKQVKLVRPIDEMIALLKPIGDMDKHVTSGCTAGCSMFIVLAAAVGSQIGGDQRTGMAARRDAADSRSVVLLPTRHVPEDAEDRRLRQSARRRAADAVRPARRLRSE